MVAKVEVVVVVVFWHTIVAPALLDDDVSVGQVLPSSGGKVQSWAVYPADSASHKDGKAMPWSVHATGW